MQYYFRYIPCIFLAVACLATANAQLYFKNRTLTVTDGLSDNRVTCFYKDTTGYVWIGTKNGLNRYNGHSFTIYKPLAEPSVSNEVINAVTGDRHGNIWVATMNGLNRFNPETKEWTTWFSDNSRGKNGLPNSLVWDIAFDDDALWIASDVFAFAKFDPAKNNFTYYDWPGFVKSISGKQTERGYHSIQRFLKKNKHEFWLASNKGLVHLNTVTKQFTYIGGNYNENVHDLKWDSVSAQLYLSLKSGRIFSYNPQQQVYKELFAAEEAYPSTLLPQSNQQPFYLAGSKGLLYKNAHNSLRLIKHLPFLSFSLPPGAVTTIYTDKTGLRWTGTANGIVLHDPSQMRSAFLPLFERPEKEGMNNMTGVFYREEDSVYYACSLDPAAFVTIHRYNGAIRKITTDKNGNSLSGCYAVKEAGGFIWLLTEEKLYKIIRGEAVHFPTPIDDISVSFRDLVSDDRGNLWIATFKKGLFVYEKATTGFRQLEGAGSAYLKDVTTSLYFDQLSNKLWIGSYGRSLHVYQTASNNITSYIETVNSRIYSHLNLCNNIVADSSGKIWVATNAGGLFYQSTSNTIDSAFVQIDMRSGLQHNQVLSIVRGKGSQLWMLTSQGLSVLNTTAKPHQEFVINDALPFTAWYSEPSIPHQLCYNRQVHELAVGVAGGLLFYYPELDINIERFPILIENIVVTTNKQQVAVADYLEPLTFSHNLKKLQFEFSALYFGNAQVSYEYQLKGYDASWQKVNGQMHVVYQNLPAGNYDFHVRAVTGNNKVVAESNRINVTVEPPFWKTWWFFLLCLGFVSYAVYWINSYLQQRVNDEKILNQFATSLYGKSLLEDIFWDVAKNCVELLGFRDCVFYQVDPQRSVLVQRAAAGPKSPYNNREIINRLELAIGKGIVGTVAKTGIAERVGNTTQDPRYILDDELRFSEITVPVFVDGVLFGVIDSEHPQKHFFTKRHLRLLRRIATVCAERISKYLTEERLRTKIARDLHDEMGSTLTSINILSKVAMSNDHLSEDVQSYLQKIKDHSGKMMESMSDIVWAINPSNDSLEKVLIRMKEFAAEMLEPAGINYYFETDISQGEIQLNLEQRKDLYLIFKEAINNAVKYSNATELTILLQCREGLLLLRITDNGNGFDSHQSVSGNGIKNMESRATAMNASFHIESIQGAGTSVVLKKHIT